MSYLATETGVLGSPVELFFFQRGTECWPYTSSDRPQVLGGRTYNPVTISRGSFSRNDEAGSSTVEVRLDRLLKVNTRLLDGSNPRPVNITIYRRHRTDAEYIVLFKGVVANATLQGQEVILTCVSPLSADEKSVPRELILRTCPHVLYGPRCQLDPTDYAYQGTISTVNGTIVTVSGISITTEDHFTAGVLIHEGTGQRAFVQYYRYYSGAQFTLLTPPPADWGASDAVTAYVGCDRKVDTCRDKFNNVPNFGGFPLHPERNPFLDLKIEED